VSGLLGGRRDYDGFSILLPPGWHEINEDATYSDPDEVPAAAFGTGSGTLHVSLVALEEDDEPTLTRDAARTLALDWGRRRGLAAPLAVAAGAGAKGATATASYRLGGDFVQVWFLTNGHDVIQASYVTGWGAQESERDAREAAVASLRFRP